ncbi:MAG: peptidoglycan DD-metalloendopeptidase family protein, partial [Chloroflexia bacterium]
GKGQDPWALHPAGTVSTWLWADRFSPCRWPEGAILVDESDPAFQRSGNRWSEGGGGVKGKALWAPSEPHSGMVPVGGEQLDGIVEGGTWRPDLPRTGRYHLYAFIPYWNNATPDTRAARYLIHHAGGETIVSVDQSLWVDRWADLGLYDFPAGRQSFVYLDILTDEEGFCVWFDAVLWVPDTGGNR